MAYTYTHIRPVAIALIVTLASACDNVDWGGADIAIVPPPPSTYGSSEETEERAADAPARVPDGPVLYHVRAVNQSARLVPIAELQGDRLAPIQPGQDPAAYANRFVSRHLRQAAEFALFHEGRRVGTVDVRNASLPAGNVCPRLPRADGIPQLVPGADSLREFLALPESYVADAVLEPYQATVAENAWGLLPAILAEDLLRARGAPLPSNWATAVVQVTPFPLPGTEDPAFAATLLVDDTLGTGLDDEGYSLFYIARPTPEGYDTVYVAYRPYQSEGKGAPAVIGYLDWNGDDVPELLLRVFGTSGAWFEAVGVTAEGDWQRIFRGPCAARRLTPGAAPDTVSDQTTDSAAVSPEDAAAR